MASRNSWNVRYNSILFFCRVLRTHSRVSSVRRSRDILFHVDLAGGTQIDVLLVDEYVLGLAAVHRAVDEFPSVEYIVTAGKWNGYTIEAKRFGAENDIGIFVIDEFLGALNRTEPKKYVRKDDNGNPEYRYKVA